MELHPDTAKTLGLSDGDGVTVVSPFGSIQTFVSLHPEIAPDVVAIPLGQGHTRYGKYARERGGNPFTLLPETEEGTTRAPAWQSTRVALSKATVPGRLVRTASTEGQWKIEHIL